MSKVDNEYGNALPGVRLVGNVVKSSEPVFVAARELSGVNGGKPVTIPAQWEGNIKVLAGEMIVSAGLTWSVGGHDSNVMPKIPQVGEVVNIGIVSMSKLVGGSLCTVRAII
jgi:hypothetical protein